MKKSWIAIPIVGVAVAVAAILFPYVQPSEEPRDDLSLKQPASEQAGGIGSPDASKTSDRPFVTTWKTTSPSESITIPVGNATGAYTVDWGDGSMSANVTGDQAHAY